MFQAAEIGHRLSKDEYEAILPDLRVDLVNTQFDLRSSADFSVVMVLMGDHRMGVTDALNRLHEWMDPRGIVTHFYGNPTEEERLRPHYWRFWRDLPEAGSIGVFLGGWTMRALLRRLDGELNDEGLHHAIDRIQQFERDLVDDGTLLLKFWMHLSRDEQRKRLKAAEKTPERVWWIGEEERNFYDLYDEALPICERVLEKTSTGEAPWHVIESTDDRYRNITFARTLGAALQHRLENGRPKPAPAPISPRAVDEHTILDTIDLTKSLPRDTYRKQLAEQQARFYELTHHAWEQQVATVLVFEGWDAAGKGGAIRRLMAGSDPRLYTIVPIAAPTDEEKAHHYLWRFWRRIPRDGEIMVFDRSWYGRVLVERVEGFATDVEWRRAYAEIRDFEDHLCHHGTVVQKFWLHISPEEQLKRFKAREQTAYKQHKITDEDYRNRERWHDYEIAINEMVARTGTSYAPWHIVPANNKRYARVQVIKLVCDALEARLGTVDSGNGRRNSRKNGKNSKNGKNGKNGRK